MTRENRRKAHEALEAYINRNPTKCTREYDGICRCRESRTRADLRPARTTANVQWRREA